MDYGICQCSAVPRPVSNVIHFQPVQSSGVKWSGVFGLKFSNIENLYSPGELSIIIDKHISSHL